MVTQYIAPTKKQNFSVVYVPAGMNRHERLYVLLIVYTFNIHIHVFTDSAKGKGYKCERLFIWQVWKVKLCFARSVFITSWIELRWVFGTFRK